MEHKGRDRGPFRLEGVRERSGETDADVVVVGSGVAGLAAATYLARAGRSVLLFEKSTATGGRAASQRHQGYIFNLGAHALYSKSPAIAILNELGVAFPGGTPGGIRCVNGGSNYLAPVDTASLLRTELLAPSAKWEAGRVLLKLQLAKPESLAGTSLRTWLSREVRHESVRRLLEASARVVTYTNAPEQLSMGLFVEQLQQATKGKVIYVDGGWQTLVDGLEGVAQSAGVRIVTGARVESVEHSEGSVSGVLLNDGTTCQAKAAIVAVGPGDAAQLVKGEESEALRGWAESAVPVEVACLDVALRRLPQPRNKVVMGIDRPLFLTVQSEFSRVTADGGVLLYALKYLDPAAPQDAEADKRDLEEWLDHTQSGWRDEVVERRYLPHLLVSNSLVTAAHGGTMGRPAPAVPGVRNLYVAGDWIGAEGILVSASLSSARAAALAILSEREVASLGKVA